MPTIKGKRLGEGRKYFLLVTRFLYELPEFSQFAKPGPDYN